MKFFNFLLALAISVTMALLVLEGGLRLIGMGPPKLLIQPHERLGWSKKRGVSITRETSEGFQVTFNLNDHALRDDPELTPEKAAGTFRAVALGDSFTLGMTVAREDLFVDLLEDWWRAEGRRAEIVNTGTEAYSTDQEATWLLEYGEEWRPDLVLLFPYDNDIYWNGENDYAGMPKPRFTPEGEREQTELEGVGPPGFWMRTALGRLFHKKSGKVRHFRPGSKSIEEELGVLLDERPDFVDRALDHTRGALRALVQSCQELGAELVVVPIPSHSAVDPDYRAAFEKRFGLAQVAWSPDNPIEALRQTALDAGIPAERVLDVRQRFRDQTAAGTDLYFFRDWHLNPAGNRSFAEFLHGELDRLGLVPPAERPASMPQPVASVGEGLPTWLYLFVVLWALLGIAYARVYRKLEKWPGALAKVGALLAVVFVIAVGGSRLLGLLEPHQAQKVLILLIAALLGFVVYKLGRRMGTIFELLGSFILRGHWYLMPLVTVLLTVGSLLVVAASSPLVAPFIYTLF